ncbi:MAG TPA: glycerol-3-phosphate acyltransferase [Capillimicrobium sp.]
MEYAVAAVLGYLLGSIPVALLVARRHGVDLRAVGDGNPGAWNALEQLGARRAWPAFVGDGLKGAAAGAAGFAQAGAAGAYAGVAGAMIGHALPVFARFRGGKSVMTFAGGAFALCLPAAAIALAVCAAVSLAARSFAWGARVGVFGFPAVQLAFDPPGRVAATGLLMALIGVLFLLRRSGPARSSRDAPRTT